jgi:hypothetical protein
MGGSEVIDAAAHSSYSAVSEIVGLTDNFFQPTDHCRSGQSLR